jgi:hypothetical protein
VGRMARGCVHLGPGRLAGRALAAGTAAGRALAALCSQKDADEQLVETRPAMIHW